MRGLPQTKNLARCVRPCCLTGAVLMLWRALLGEIAAQDFTYTNTNGTITITGYTGPGGAVIIPGGINGLAVTSIGNNAFGGNTTLTSVIVPNSVTNIGGGSFAECANLASVTIGDSVTSIGGLAFNACTSLTRLSIPDSVTTIGVGLAPVGGTFGFCSSLTNVTIGKNVTNIGDYAFVLCGSMRSVYFRGNSPNLGAQVFDFSAATVYYLPTAAGWGPTFAGHPTKLWNAQAETNDASFGVRQNRFGFNIAGTAEIPFVIEANTDLNVGPWVLLQSGTLTNGLVYFSDPQWTNYPSRFYRVRSP
jgi:hypothetical protein